MEQHILQWGDYAKAISAILALVALILVRPIKAAWKQHKNDKEEEKAFRKAVFSRLDSIDASIKNLVDDMGDMQYEHLAQAHDFYTSQGWCPSTTKQQLCNMHKSYKAKKRNHLSDAYEEEILKLREHP